MTEKTLNDRQVLCTHMDRHNFHTANHGEGIIHLNGLFHTSLKKIYLKIEVKYHTRIETNTIIKVNDHTCIFPRFSREKKDSPKENKKI